MLFKIKNIIYVSMNNNYFLQIQLYSMSLFSCDFNIVSAIKYTA